MRKKYFKKIVFILTLAIISLGFSYCGQRKSDQEGKVKVGVVVPLTGPLGFIGEYEKNALQLGLKDYYSAHHKKLLHFIFEDCKGSPKLATNIANKFVSIDKVSLAISSPSYISYSVLGIFEKAGIPHFVFSFDPQLPAKSNLVFRFFESSTIEARGFIKFISNAKIKKVVFLRHMHPDAEKAFNLITKPALKKLGIKVIDIPYPLSTRDFKNYIEKIKSLHPDLLIIQAFGYLIPDIMKAIKESKLNVPILGDLNFLEIEPQHRIMVDRIPFVCFDYVFSDSYKHFVEHYRKEFHKEPLAPAAFCYDLAYILSTFIDKNNGRWNTDKFRLSYLKGELKGKIIKQFTVTENLDITISPTFCQYTNGAISKWR